MSTTTAKIAWQAIYHRNGVGNNNRNFSDDLARVLNTKWPNVSEKPIGKKMVMDCSSAGIGAERRSNALNQILYPLPFSLCLLPYIPVIPTV